MDEYVRKQDVVETIHKEILPFIYSEDDSEYMTEKELMALSINKAVCKRIKSLQAEDVQPVRHGRWIRHNLKKANVPWGYDCSVCGEWFVIGNDTAKRYNYCPKCGAHMEGSE